MKVIPETYRLHYVAYMCIYLNQTTIRSRPRLYNYIPNEGEKRKILAQWRVVVFLLKNFFVSHADAIILY